jgi:hypothetical protein
MKADKKFTEYINNIDKSRWSNAGLAIYYKYSGEEEKARHAFEEAANQVVFTSRFPINSTEEEKKNPQSFNTKLLVNLAEIQVKNGIENSLAHKKPEYVRRLFEWSAENCILTDERLAALIKYKNFEDIAVAYLWRGYALLILGRYDKANNCLNQVRTYFNESIKYGGKTSKVTEYRLSTALVPLSKYKLEQNEENKQAAVKGLEDFIDSFKDPGEKYEAFIYYYHLEESFPDVYKIQPVHMSKKAKAKPSKMSVLPSSQDEIRGKIVVFDQEASGSLEVFGTVNELEEYVNKVTNLGDYPTLSRLLEIYGLDEQQDPEPLIEESERLLATPGLDQDFKKKTQQILNVTIDANKMNSTIMLYLDENL